MVKVKTGTPKELPCCSEMSVLRGMPTTTSAFGLIFLTQRAKTKKTALFPLPVGVMHKMLSLFMRALTQNTWFGLIYNIIA